MGTGGVPTASANSDLEVIYIRFRKASIGSELGNLESLQLDCDGALEKFY